MSTQDPQFWVTVFPSDGTAAVRVSDRILSLEYEDDESKADKLKLLVDNHDLTQLDNLLWKNGNKIECSWGYPGNMSPARECWVQSVKGSLTLTVEALGKEILMNKVQKTRTFENMTRSEVAALIAKENGFAPDRQFIENTIFHLDQITQARMTDTQLLRSLAQREGYEYYVDFDGFHFHKRKLGQKPKKKFEYFADLTGDIIAWNVDKDIYVAKSAGVTLQGRDPMKKEDIDVAADNVTNKDRTSLAPTVELVLGISNRDGTATSEFEKPGASTAEVKPTTEKTKDLAARSAAGAHSKSQLAAIELSVTARGDPLWSAKAVAEITGISKLLSGNYYCKNVTHKVSEGYTMVCKFKRDGTSGTGAGKTVPTKAATNTAQAPEEEKPKDLLPINRRDGTVEYSEGGSQANAPTQSNEPTQSLPDGTTG